jgi:hypothetical protein
MSVKKTEIQKVLVDNKNNTAAASTLPTTPAHSHAGSAGAQAIGTIATTAASHSHSHNTDRIANFDAKTYVEFLQVNTESLNYMTPMRLKLEDAIVRQYQILMNQFNTGISTDHSQNALAQPNSQNIPAAKDIAKTIEFLSKQFVKDYKNPNKFSLSINVSFDEQMPTIIFAVADMLSKNIPLHSLYLHYEFTIDAAIALANALKNNTNLEYLSIGGIHNLGDVGCTIIANALHHNKTLTELVINCAVSYNHKFNNTVNDLTAKVFSEILKNNSTLQKLRLLYTKITELGAEFLAKGLLINKTLKVLDLGSSTVGPNCYGTQYLISVGHDRVINLTGCVAPRDSLQEDAEDTQVEFKLVRESFVAIQKVKTPETATVLPTTNSVGTAKALATGISSIPSSVTAFGSATSAAPITFSATASAAGANTVQTSSVVKQALEHDLVAPVKNSNNQNSGTGAAQTPIIMVDKRSAELGPTLAHRRSFVKGK